jgi:chorismate mutase-like protein
MSASDSSLEPLRREIDRIDDAMHDLLMRRAEVIATLRQGKTDEGVVVFRPGREARILRRLARRHAGPLPAQVVVRVWREIIAAALRLQGPFTLAVHAPDGARALVDLAQEHFGMLTPVRSMATLGLVLRALEDGSAQLGIVPLPGEGPTEPWWRALGASVSVLARLPFIAAHGPAALVIGTQPFEPTGEDRGFLAFEMDREIGRQRITAALASVGLKPQGVMVEVPSNAPGAPIVQLVEIDPYVASDDPRLKSFRATLGEEGLRVRVAGGYAVPLRLDGKESR